MTDFLKDLHQAFSDSGVIFITVRVRPRAPTTQIKGVMADGTLKIDLAAAVEDGKANAELVAFLAEEFDVPRREITIVSGAASRRKMIRVER